MENRLSFSKIHITEWLWKINPNTGEPDRRTGHETYRELKAILTETGSRMQAVYRLRVLGQWFDGIRFYAAASSPRRSRRT